jgi:alpha-N-acetylglucosaminidase
LISAWELLVNASTEIDSDLFRYDLVDITKEVLQYKFAGNYVQFVAAYNRKDLYNVGFVSFVFCFYVNDLIFFSTQATILMNLLADIEMLLASDRRFLLGNWVGDALQFARSEEEIHLYNFNAKLQVSLWGNIYTSGLFDYANKFWSGMIREYVQIDVKKTSIIINFVFVKNNKN